MDLGFNEEQQSLKQSARNFLEKECTPALVREVENDGRGFPRALWSQMAQLEWLGLPFAERYGGLGADLVTVAALIEELGRACDPTPYLPAIIGCGLLVQDAATESQKLSLLPHIGRGEVLLVPALLERDDRYVPEGIQLRAEEHGGAFVLNGTKLFVENADVADYLLVAARTCVTKDAAEGITLFLLDPKADGVSLARLSSLGQSKLFQVKFDALILPEQQMIGPRNYAWPHVAAMIRRTAALQCVAAVGGAQRVLEMTIDYAKVRVQFGKPIGSFQAVQHHCANMWMDIETAWLAAYEAICLMNEGRRAEQELAVAKAWTSEVYTRTCLTAHQIHGGIGFMMEYDLQLWTRKAKAMEAAWGTADFYRRELAKTL